MKLKSLKRALSALIMMKDHAAVLTLLQFAALMQKRKKVIK